METASAAAVPSAPRLRRTLTLWDLILYGIIVIQPTAPMPAYGVFSNAGQGHVVTSILIAMIAMVFTAMSYGRMARVYPSAGSAYTYVGRELHPSLGYVTGWSMTMDYILNPLICTIWSVLTYIGFDGISTLSEEVDNPRRNIFLATVLVCVITGFLAAAEVYGAQLLSPQTIFPESEVENAFSHVAAIAGGALMTKAISLTLLIATIGSGMGSQLGAARLLYGMGRSGAIPKKFFGAIHPRTRIPANNVVFVGAIALVGAFLISYDDGANLLNFGALIAFMGVNLASLTHYYVRGNDRTMGQLIPPVLGFVICFLLWISLSSKAKIFGAIWMVVGIAYGAWKTRGFQSELVNFDVPPEE